jgi:FRG domain
VITKRVASENPPICITSVGEMIKLLMNKNADRRILWYRGHRQASWELAPTIWRKKYEPRDERNFAHRFRSRAAIRMNDAPKYNNMAHWIALMRHYGLPTRLLDWSRSPLVALYFALEYLLEDAKSAPQNSVVWALDPHRMNELENVKKLGNLTPSIQSKTCERFLTGAFFERRKEPNKIIAVMAHDVDMRIFVQQGCFTIHSSRVALNEKRGNKDYLFPMLISAENARRMADEVVVSGLRKGDIYPDLGNLATEIIETDRRSR